MAPGGKGRMATWYSRWRWHAGTTRICTQRSSGRGAVVDERARGGRGAGIPEEVTRRWRGGEALGAAFPVGKPGTASQFQRRELVAVPALRRRELVAVPVLRRVSGFAASGGDFASLRDGREGVEAGA